MDYKERIEIYFKVVEAVEAELDALKPADIVTITMLKCALRDVLFPDTDKEEAE